MDDVMETAFYMLKSCFSKMGQSHAIYGSVIGAIVSIPAWIESDGISAEHIVMMIILGVILYLDRVTGKELAKRSPVKLKGSHVGNSSTIRNAVIVCICTISVGFDFVFKTRSFIFAIFTAAFIWQNFYSLLGNVITLGWGKYFPLWLFSLIEKWVEDEVRIKQNKYFPTGENRGEKDEFKNTFEK